MAEHTKKALDFLKTLTAYIQWRARNRQPSTFDVTHHVTAFGGYLESCGIKAGTPLYDGLVEHMKSMERAGGVRVEPPPS